MSAFRVRWILLAAAAGAVMFWAPLSPSDGSLPALVAQAHAQTAQAAGDLMFFPVGNQDVRKLVFWDRRTNQIHIYGGSGKFEETWQIGSMGQDLKKQ